MKAKGGQISKPRFTHEIIGLKSHERERRRENDKISSCASAQREVWNCSHTQSWSLLCRISFSVLISFHPSHWDEMNKKRRRNLQKWEKTAVLKLMTFLRWIREWIVRKEISKVIDGISHHLPLNFLSSE